MNFRLKISYCVLLFSLSIPSVSFPQFYSNIKQNPFSGTLVFSLQSGITTAFTDYETIKVGYLGSGSAEYFLPSSNESIFGLKMFLGGQNISGSDTRKSIYALDGNAYNLAGSFRTDMYIIGGGISFSYGINYKFFPYIYTGISNIWFSPKDINGKILINNSNHKYDKTSIQYDVELGLRTSIQDNVSLYGGVGFHFLPTDYLDDVAASRGNDIYSSFVIGISLSFLGNKDSDGDWILDNIDKCPDQPEDYDGFQDEDGCPDLDNDGDGIPDSIDKCPNDPEDFDGFQDSDGCPDIDNDSDGINDKNDKCPNEPEDFDGFQDNDGCPDLDNDNDGIADSVDQCPNEPENFNGYKDEDGCPDVEFPSALKEITLAGSTTFIGNTAKIKSEAYPELDKIVRLLKSFPQYLWRIEGHMDSSGPDQYIRTISRKRAEAVMNYFINKGLKASKFHIYGLGDKFPVANNNTEYGRMKNRRVVIIREE